MPDYTAILRRSISALPDSRPEMREAVYQRARAALARQLTAVDPPLSSREIERQHQELEGAVARLEAEIAPDGGVGVAPQARRAEPSPLSARLDERATSRTDRDKADRERAERAERDRAERDRAERDRAERERTERAARLERTSAAAFRVEPAPPAAAAAPAIALAPPPSAAATADQDYDAEDEDDSDDYEDDEGGSRAPLLVGLIVVLLVAGLGFYGYTQQDRVLTLLGMAESGEAASPPAAAEPPADTPSPVVGDQVAAGAPDADKAPDRLTNGSEPPAPVEPLPSEEQAAPDTQIVLPAEEDAAAEPETPVVPSGEAATPPAGQQTAALDPSAQSIVAQRAIYYFQGAQGQPGKATEGTVAWSQITRDSGPAVQATLKMAGQDTTTTVTIYKNNDSGLPASHLVEVQFSGELGPSPVQRVPALVLKQTEQARGQPLTGAAVPVTGDLFWIALSNDAEQVKRNLQLMRDGSWFDVPILFTDGTRALLTFEKGIPGDKVFETVLSAWTPS